MSAPRWFYLGPLGRMVALPCPEPGLDNALRKHSAMHVSLNARVTEDIHGYRREWALDLPWLDADDLGYLEACFTGVISGPLRLLDPTRRNRLTLAASATDLAPDWPGGTRAASVSTGILSATREAGWPNVDYLSRDGRPASYRGDASLAWIPTSPGVLTLDGGPTVVAVPGETLTASAYVRSDGGELATLEIVPHTAAGELAPVAGTSTSATTWQRLSVTYSVPSDGVAIVPRVRIGTTSGIIRVAAAQVEPGTEASPWTPGAGCPEVIITELPARSPVWPLVSAALTLREM